MSGHGTIRIYDFARYEGSSKDDECNDEVWRIYDETLTKYEIHEAKRYKVATYWQTNKFNLRQSDEEILERDRKDIIAASLWVAKNKPLPGELTATYYRKYLKTVGAASAVDSHQIEQLAIANDMIVNGTSVKQYL